MKKKDLYVKLAAFENQPRPVREVMGDLFHATGQYLE